MHPLRSLLWPLRFTALLLIVLVAPLLAMAASGGWIGLPALYLLSAMCCRYADQLLGQALQGDTEPVPLSLETLNPFNLRPLLAMGWLVAVGLIVLFGQGTASLLLALALLGLLPAALAIVHLEGWRLSVINPFAWLKLIIAMGPWYLLLAALGFVGLVLLAMASRAGLPLTLQIAWALYLLFGLLALTGAICHRRRFELGYEPMASPERDAARAAQDRERERATFIDPLYLRVRNNKRGEAQAILDARLRDLDPQWLDEEADALFAAAIGWQLPRVLPWLGETLVERQLRAGHVHGALESATRLLHADAAWRPPAGELRDTLVQLASEAGRVDLAHRLQADLPAAP
ncbi:MAG: hypothetical protein RL684_2811 [Pseudomonadota bacterium]|jgi:hypothetical protein